MSEQKKIEVGDLVESWEDAKSLPYLSAIEAQCGIVIQKEIEGDWLFPGYPQPVDEGEFLTEVPFKVLKVGDPND